MVRITKQISSFTQKEIQELFKNTRLVVGQLPLLVRVGPAQKAVGRLLLVIPKAVGSAPIRNKLRRRLKALFYQDKLYTQGKDCIVLARAGASELLYEQLQELLHKAVTATSSVIPNSPKASSDKLPE